MTTSHSIAVEKLIEMADHCCYGFTLDDLRSPDWEAHRWSWPHYIDNDIRDLWDDLPLEAKLLAFIHASDECERDDPRD